MHRNFYKSVFFFFSSGKFIAAMRDTETALLCIVDFYARFFSSNNFPPPSHLFFQVTRAFLVAFEFLLILTVTTLTVKNEILDCQLLLNHKYFFFLLLTFNSTDKVVKSIIIILWKI